MHAGLTHPDGARFGVEDHGLALLHVKLLDPGEPFAAYVQHLDSRCVCRTSSSGALPSDEKERSSTSLSIYNLYCTTAVECPFSPACSRAAFVWSFERGTLEGFFFF